MSLLGSDATEYGFLVYRRWPGEPTTVKAFLLGRRVPLWLFGWITGQKVQTWPQ